MNSLSHILLSVPDSEALVNDLATTIETHIAKQGGLSGLALKAGYGALRAAKPDIASRAVRRLLPVVAQALEPIYAESRDEADVDFGDYLKLHSNRAASLVVAAIDPHIEGSPNSTVRAVYKKFRGSAAGELNKLMPALGKILSAHLS